MRALINWRLYAALALVFLSILVFRNFISTKNNAENEESRFDNEDGIRLAQQQEFRTTKDLQLGIVPKFRLYSAINDRVIQTTQTGNSTGRVEAMVWTERGSYSDAVGPSNGNGRPGSPTPVTSGRMRAIWVDLSDATGKIVWAAGIDGGLWKTTDITAAPANWTPVNDQFGNLAIGSICQDPTGSKNTMYFGTGEKTFNIDAVQGGGVWKSTDHGLTWSLLANTTGFYNVSKVICDNAGNIYVATIGSGAGLKRSTDGGTNWTTITPTVNGGAGTMNTTRVADMTYDAAANKLHVVMGYLPGAGTVEGYCFSTTPSTVTSATWTAPTTSFITSPNTMDNCAIVCSGNTVYATPANTSDIVPTIYKTTDGGANWAATTTTPINSGNNAYTNGQGWYCLALGVDPANANNVIVGSLNCYKTTDGGATWAQISVWVGGGAVNNYVHADQHFVTWNGSQVLIGSDGGIFYSANAGTSFFDRNVNLRLKQFYSVAIDPTLTNYFLAGAQDNGVHQFNSTGLAASVEVKGGDGVMVAIDQTQSQYQFGTYVYNHYHRSTDNGATWADLDFYKGNVASLTEFGSFANAFDYDDANNIIYAGADAGEFFRWTNPQTLASGSYHQGGAGFPAGVTINAVSNMTGAVSSVFISPYTGNRIWLGTDNGQIIRIDNANSFASGSAGTSLSAGLVSGSNISSITTGTDDNHMLATVSNYGTTNVWYSSDGGATWTSIDGTLPDMPVRWAMFFPNDNTKAMIATEMGVYETSSINGGATTWVAETGFPIVRTDMLQYRSSDKTVVAATHGRGLWSAQFSTVLPVTLLHFGGQLVNDKMINLDWSTSSEMNSDHFTLEKSIDGNNFKTLVNMPAAGNTNARKNYAYSDHQPGEVNYYRLKMVDIDGRFTYSQTILVRDPGATQTLIVLGNPFKETIHVRLAKMPMHPVVMELYNVSGEKISHQQIGQAIELDMVPGKDLSKGNYILKVWVDGIFFTRQLSKE
jgi:hypothetical protein